MDKKFAHFYKYVLFYLFFCIILVILSYYFFDKPLAKWVYLHHIQKNHFVIWIISIPSIAVFLSSMGVIVLFTMSNSTINSLQKNKISMWIVATAWSSYLSLLLVTGFKYLFGRMSVAYLINNHFNPNAYGFYPFSGYNSFPSGHTSVSFAMITVLYSVYPKLRVPSLLMGLLIVMSLISTQNHFLSDCIAGCFLGTVVGFLIARFFELDKVLGK